MRFPSVSKLSKFWKKRSERRPSSVIRWFQGAVKTRLQELERRVEWRAWTATAEARAYAEEGLQTLAASLRASNQRVVALGTELDATRARIEFVRTEILYELQAAQFKAGAGAAPGAQATVARVLDIPKLEAMRSSGLRLNVGCGHIPLEGYINIDQRKLPGVDMIADANAIPVEQGEVAELGCSHLVEHFSQPMLERVLLPHWFSLLRPGGKLTTVAPDGAAMLSAVNAGDMTFEDFREVLFGSQDYDGDFHYNLITPDSFRATLERAGFTGIELDYSARRNGKCFEFRMTALRP